MSADLAAAIILVGLGLVWVLANAVTRRDSFFKTFSLFMGGWLMFLGTIFAVQHALGLVS